MNIIARLLVAIWLSVAYAPVGAQTPPTQTEFALYRDAAVALNCTVSGAQFAWPGSALTASTTTVYFNFSPKRPITYARWVVAWNPNTGASPTGLRLVHADDGPSNVTEIARITGMNYFQPRVDAVDVTATMQSLSDGASYKHIGHQTFGNGMNGCLIYSSVLLVVWGF